MSRGAWCYSALLVVLIGLAVVPSTARTATRRDDVASTPSGPSTVPAQSSDSLVLPPRLCSVDPDFAVPAPPFAGDPGFFLPLPTFAADPGFVPSNGAPVPGESFCLAPAGRAEPGGRSRTVRSGSLLTAFFEAPLPTNVMPPNGMPVATPTS